NYTWSKSLTNLSVDNQNQSLDYTTLRNPGLDKRVSPFDIRHVIQTLGTYDLPIGRGRLVDVNNRVLDTVVGGWTLGSIFVFQTGQPIQLTGGFATVNTTNNPAFGGVRLAPGVTLQMIQDMFNASRTRITGRTGTTDLQRLGVDPMLIGPDGRANPAFLTWNTTPGEFGQLLFLRDKNTFTWDVSMTKSIGIMEKGRLQVFASMNNVLNHPRWVWSDLTALGPAAGTGPVPLNTFSTSFGVMDAQRSPQPSVLGNRSINLRATLSF